MTLYLAKMVVDGAVDETATVYLARCDDGDCRYLADHASSEVVEDALDGHRRRAHATATPRTEDTTRTAWMPAWSYGPIATVAGSETTDERSPSWEGARSDHDASGGRPTDPPAWAPADDPHPGPKTWGPEEKFIPSPAPRGEEEQ